MLKSKKLLSDDEKEFIACWKEMTSEYGSMDALDLLRHKRNSTGHPNWKISGKKELIAGLEKYLIAADGEEKTGEVIELLKKMLERHHK